MYYNGRCSKELPPLILAALHHPRITIGALLSNEFCVGILNLEAQSLWYHLSSLIYTGNPCHYLFFLLYLIFHLLTPTSACTLENCVRYGIGCSFFSFSFLLPFPWKEPFSWVAITCKIIIIIIIPSDVLTDYFN